MEKIVEAAVGRPKWPARDRSFRRFKVTKEQLEDLYVTKNMTLGETATALGMSSMTLREYFLMLDVPLRPGNEGARRSITHPSINESYFECINTHEKAYVLGFIVGDGCVVNRGRSKRITISLAETDVEVLEFIANQLNAPEMVKHGVVPSDGRGGPKCVLAVNRTKMANDLLALGVKVSPHTGIEEMISLPTPELTWSFILGFSDADGCVRNYQRSYRLKDGSISELPRFKWALTAGERIITGIRDFIVSQGVKLSDKCIQPKGVVKVLETSNPTAIKQIRDKMYANCSFFLSRKREKFFSF